MGKIETLAADIAEYLADDRELEDFIENTDLDSNQLVTLKDSHGYKRVSPDVREILELNPAHVYSKARLVLDYFGV